MRATYVSVWDDSEKIETSCIYNPDTKCVTEVECVDVEDVDTLTEEYIELPDGTTINRQDYFLEGEDF